MNMTQSLTYILGEGLLTWKPDSLGFLANDSARPLIPALWSEEVCVLDRSSAPCYLPRFDLLPVLGILLDQKGDTPVSLEHRISSSQQHFFARQSQLTCPRVPLGPRISRHYTTVSKTLLWGAGGWTPGLATLRRVEILELSFLRRVCRLRRLPDEGFLDFQLRSAACVRLTLQKLGQHSISYLVLSNYHSWAGHVARLPLDHPLARVVRWRNLSWWKNRQAEFSKTDPHNPLGWRHPSRGSHNHRWETALSEFYDCYDWLHVAQDRASWKASSDAFVRHFLAKWRCRNDLSVFRCPVPPPGPPAESGFSPGTPADVSPPLVAPPRRSLPSPFRSSALPFSVLSLSLPALRTGRSSNCIPTCISDSSLAVSTLHSTALKISSVRIMVAVLGELKQNPQGFLLHVSQNSNSKAISLANSAIKNRVSNEFFSGSPAPLAEHKGSLYILAQCHGCHTSSGAVASIVISLGSSAHRLHEVLCLGVFLGKCARLSAELQAANICLTHIQCFVHWMLQ